MSQQITCQKEPRYILSGPVVRGRGRGRSIDMPTANIKIQAGAPLPPHGVYISLAAFEGRSYAGVTNVGRRPTVDNDPDVTVETYILGFSGDLYGKIIEVRLFKFLRPPQKFESAWALREQVARDCQAVLRFFGC